MVRWCEQWKVGRSAACHLPRVEAELFACNMIAIKQKANQECHKSAPNVISVSKTGDDTSCRVNLAVSLNPDINKLQKKWIKNGCRIQILKEGCPTLYGVGSNQMLELENETKGYSMVITKFDKTDSEDLRWPVSG
uniref:Uncharacterized protein n=1 Tax=Ditylenchus dipsaci TaxID=166011 RepID=A0A915E9V3_9BILA